jgi:hypothetical protein
MKSETQIRAELAETLLDLADWRRKLENCRDNDRRRIIGQTICGVEGRMEALEWVLKEH